MKSLLMDILQNEADDFHRRSTTREYLQARILLALQQSGWKAGLTSETWRPLIADRLANVNWSQVLEDVSPFLEREQDTALVSEDVLLPLLQDR